MKYIMLESKETGQKFPIIFPSHFVHSDVKLALQSLVMFKKLEPISAGEITIHNCSVYGKSETLALVSILNDSNIIEMHDILHGIG